MRTLSSGNISENYDNNFDLPLVVKDSFNTLSVDAMFAMALQERDAMVSGSSMLQDFQKEIDTAMKSFTEVNRRFEGLADAARSFRKKRDIPARLAELMHSSVN
ncbi:MAG: hypothetical protein HQK62_10980 [Desulfamplus sp.]|nr:hypothetical protein [Desulfamplus sp.]